MESCARDIGLFGNAASRQVEGHGRAELGSRGRSTWILACDVMCSIFSRASEDG